MRRILLLGTLPLLLGGSRSMLAQDVSASLKTGTIEGVVTKTTGEPLAGAQVTITPIPHGPSLTAMTTSDGRYSIADLPAGQYALAVTRTLVARARKDSTRTVGLTAGEHLTGVNIQLVPTGVITEGALFARILDSQRMPAAKRFF